MDCKRVSRLIDAYAANELGGDRAGEVKAHVDGCPACAKAVDEFRAAILVLRTHAGPSPEADARFFHKLDSRLDAADGRAGVIPQSIINWRSAFGFAAAAAAIFFVSVYFVPMTPVTTDRAATAAPRADRYHPTIALREAPTVPAYRWRGSDYAPVSLSSAQRPVGQDIFGQGQPRFTFPRQGWPIEGTQALQTQSTISMVDYERLQTRVSDLEMRLTTLEHKSQ